MRFRDIQHQDRALSILRRALRSGRTHHAYLFEGPEGVGKEMAARALAARLLCEDLHAAPAADACGQCRSCRLLATDNHPDFHLIHRGLHRLHPDRAVRSSKGLYLVVDLIRTFLIEPAASTPSLGRRRIFLIRDAERMNEEAQNALLKTLEEPPGAAGLLLVTASAERLLPTIRSRCQRVPFDLLPATFIEAQLVAQLGLVPAAAQTLACLAGGRLGAALRWHALGLLDTLEEVGACLDRLSGDDPEGFARALLEIATALATRFAAPVEAEAAEAGGNEGETAKANGAAVPTDELRDALKLVLMLVAALYRDALAASIGPDVTRHLPLQQTRADRLARTVPPGLVEAAARAVAGAEYMLDRNVAPQLVGEQLAAALSGAVSVR